MGVVVVPSFGADPVTVTGPTLDAKVDGLATEFNGNIENANIKSTAAIAYSKLALTGAVLNADLAGSIADSKLSTITTAGKVSGAALTLLPNVPSAAGILPNVNNIGGAVEIVFDNAGNEIEDNLAIWVVIPKAITITGYYALADVAGAINIECETCTYANYAATWSGTDITGGHDIVIAATNPKSTDTTLTDWTTAVAALSVMQFKVTACTTITECTVVLTFNRA